MNRAHEHIEGLLSRRSDTGAPSDGFRERVAEGVAGEAPGALPAGSPVLPAGVKGVIGLGVAGAASALVWFAVTAGPSAPERSIVQNPGTGVEQVETPISVAQGTSAIDVIRKISEQMAKGTEDKTDLFAESRKMLAGALRVGEAFVSVFPREWTDLLWKPSPSRRPAPAGEPAAESESPTLQG